MGTELIIIAILMLVAIFLLLAEIFLLPGMTIAGIGGILFAVGGIVYAYSCGLLIGHLTIVGSLLIFIFAFLWLMRSNYFNQVSLKSIISSKVEEEQPDVQIGDRGICRSRLAPTGQVRIKDKLYEAHSTNDFIDEGSEVEVIEVQPRQLTVREIKQNNNNSNN